MSKSLTVLTTFVVFGVYTHGALAGKVNPKASCEISMWGESFKDCKAKLVNQTDGAFYRVKSVVDHSKPVLVATMPVETEVSDEQRIASAKTITEVLEILGS